MRLNVNSSAVYDGFVITAPLSAPVQNQEEIDVCLLSDIPNHCLRWQMFVYIPNWSGILVYQKGVRRFTLINLSILCNPHKKLQRESEGNSHPKTKPLTSHCIVKCGILNTSCGPCILLSEGVFLLYRDLHPRTERKAVTPSWFRFTGMCCIAMTPEKSYMSFLGVV